MRPLLIVNPRSGGEQPSAEELAAAARERGIHVHLLRPEDDLAALARDPEASAVGMAGGDGSLAPVAAVAIERDLPFVVVPFGTRNHFARDAGIDRDDPLGALEAFSGEERRIDVGRVGERLFLNNVSVGVYARLVHRRERHRRRGEALARLKALALTTRHRHPARLTLEGAEVRAPIVLVANNGYRLGPFSIGERERLDDGLLHLYVACGWLPNGWEERTGTRFVLGADRPRVRAAIDGEAVSLETPLDFRIEPGALRLLVPPSDNLSQG